MKKQKLKPGLEIYQTPDSDWRWRFVRKGRIKYASSEGYRNFAECKGNASGAFEVADAVVANSTVTPLTPLKPAKGKKLP